MTSFEAHRADVPDRRVPASGVVEAFDIGKDRHPSLGLGSKRPAIEQLALERGEEALAHGVVEAIADRAHRRPDMRLAAASAEFNRGVLGEFNGSLQQLSKEKLQWVLRNVVGLIARGVASSVL